MADKSVCSEDQIRASFLAFFKEKGSRVFASSSLVPEDPSLLLTNAGMNQFKSYYLGTKKLEGGNGATSCQKCLRTNDIDVIGLDGRHLSFFEMLGNFSFGGYTKQDACAWALEYVCDVLNIPLEKLYFTVFTDDDESEQIWQELGIPREHISRLGADDNFWAAGPTGPCGPCSEIYVDLGARVGCGKPDCAPGCDCDRFLEIWNLVFTQYDRTEDGTLLDLPHKNIDTGMGLERVSAVVKGQTSSYTSDVLAKLIELVQKMSGVSFGEAESSDISLRIIADHARAVAFMLADGILPSNEGRGYVLRRLLRRAVFHAKLLGLARPSLCEVVDKTIELMGDVYPELVENKAHIDKVVRAEEARFLETLTTGEAYLDQALLRLGKDKVLSGETAFVLHDTYGFPIDLTKEIAQKSNIVVDLDAFEQAMNAQKARARKASATAEDAWSNVDIWTEIEGKTGASEFLGYETLGEPQARVSRIVIDGCEVDTMQAGKSGEIVLDKTPFYAERGGQVGDSGLIQNGTAKFIVTDTTPKGQLIVHSGTLEAGSLSVGDSVDAEVDAKRRALIARNHTATHLLDAALKAVLGEHVKQAGSLVGAERLRFDFTHYEALTAEQIREVEDLVNEQIVAALPVWCEVLSIEEAKASGAIAQFTEKYGDEVRVITAGAPKEWFSKEFCGGTHVSNTSEIGLFKITSEASVGSAARRIEAVTSQGAISYVNALLDPLQKAAAMLKIKPTKIEDAVVDMKAREQDFKTQLKNAISNAGKEVVSELMGAAFDCGAYKTIVARVENKSAKELRGLWDQIKEKAKGPVACFLIALTPEHKTALLAAASEDAVEAGFDAGTLIKNITTKFGGRGGGKPQFAQGTLDDASLQEAAIKHAKEALG